MHVLIDLWDCDAEALGSSKLIKRLLGDWVDLMGMTALGKPVAHDVEGDEPGVTALQVITESHLSIHTFTERGIAWVDLFSCKAFDADVLARAVLAGLKGKLAEYQTVDRGFSVRGPRNQAPWWKVGPPVEENQ